MNILMDGFDTLKGLGHETNNFIRVYNILYELSVNSPIVLRFVDPIFFCGLKGTQECKFFWLRF